MAAVQPAPFAQILFVVALVSLGAVMLHRRSRIAVSGSDAAQLTVANAPFILAPSDVEEQLKEMRFCLKTGQMKESTAVAKLAEVWGISPSEATSILRQNN